MWTRIQNTELAEAAQSTIYTNNMLTYHNWSHVQSMYDYLDDMNEPYDEALDWAILFHDIVYDCNPEKEQRSINEFRSMIASYAGCNLDAYGLSRVERMILATIDHVVDHSDTSAIVRADLHALANTCTSIKNYGNIMQESMNLLGIDEVAFARANYNYMASLRSRVVNNAITDPDHASFYLSVANIGIDLTMQISQIIQEKLSGSW